jgi:UDP-N-acetylmuramoyl-tripeptide--D-alanyl-D-alanine ligase
MSDFINYVGLLVIPAILVWLVRAVVRTIRALHILQLEGYKSGRFLGWLRSHPKRLFDVGEIVATGCLIVPALILYPLNLKTLFLPFFILSWIGVEAYFVAKQKKFKSKKPLVYTARAKRVFGLSIVLLVTAVIALIWLSGELSLWRLAGHQLYSQFLVLLIFTFLLNQLAAINLTLANLLIYPLEQTINQCYLRSARKKMRNLHPKVIAITGSYGKTSTKYILNSMLSQKFNVLMTPDSYNTPMGICKVIRGQLEPEHEIFIVEMGAYQRGDIRELCRLVYPEIGILTAVGAQHLERFKNIENIARTKYELIESLPQDGIAVFNDDNEICSELANKTTIKMARYAVDRLDEKVELTARKIENTRRGLTFIIEKSSGETCKVETKLLGRNNVYNILAATAVALECGVTLDNVSHATKLLEPIPHRLQLISGAGGVTVVDDGFNANPVGARAALEVLEGFSDGRKILVTPGMVELGDMEFDENKTFGAEAAKVCEFVILVGPIQTKPILEGLRTAGFPKEKILLVENLTQASESLTNIIKSGDVVLFENDLPDSYSEGS